MLRLLPLLACVGLAAPDGASSSRECSEPPPRPAPVEVASAHALYRGNAHGAAHVARGLFDARACDELVAAAESVALWGLARGWHADRHQTYRTTDVDVLSDFARPAALRVVREFVQARRTHPPPLLRRIPIPPPLLPLRFLNMRSPPLSARARRVRSRARRSRSST